MAVDGFGPPVRRHTLGLDSVAFTVAGTFVYRVPAGVYQLFVEVFGGGGGAGGRGADGTPGVGLCGGCTGGTGGHGAPGNDGGYGADYITVAPGQRFTITVGDGGAGGGTAAAGAAGGTSSFGAVLTATGGGGGGGGGSGGNGTNNSPLYFMCNTDCSPGVSPAPSDWNPNHGTSSARINRTGGGARGGAFTGESGDAGQKGRVVIWFKK